MLWWVSDQATGYFVKQIWYLTLLILFVVACRQSNPHSIRNDQESNWAIPHDVYDFPVKPGTPAWASLQSHDEMVSVCQLPDDVLGGISTPGLVQTVLNYPLLADMYAFPTTQSGFDSVAENFTGLQELFRRDDAAKEMVLFYSELSPEVVAEKSGEEQGDYVFLLANSEIILAQYPLLAQLNTGELKTLANQTWQFLEAKETMPEVYGVLSRESSILLLARIMQTTEYEPFLQLLTIDQDVAYFVDEIAPTQDERGAMALQRIVEQAKQFVEQ